MNNIFRFALFFALFSLALFLLFPGQNGEVGAFKIFPTTIAARMSPEAPEGVNLALNAYPPPKAYAPVVLAPYPGNLPTPTPLPTITPLPTSTPSDPPTPAPCSMCPNANTAEEYQWCLDNCDCEFIDTGEIQPEWFCPYPYPTPTPEAPGMPGGLIEITAFEFDQFSFTFYFDANHDGTTDSFVNVVYRPTLLEPHYENFTSPELPIDQAEWWRVTYFGYDLVQRITYGVEAVPPSPIGGIFSDWEEIMIVVNHAMKGGIEI